MCDFNSAEYKYLSSIQQNIIDISPRKFIWILLTINESQCVAFTLSLSLSTCFKLFQQVSLG